MLPLEVSCAMTTGVPEARINKMVSVRCCRKAPREKFMILQVVRRVKRPTLAAAGAASRDRKDASAFESTISVQHERPDSPLFLSQNLLTVDTGREPLMLGT